ncbi:MAG: helix-turn-helix transcriptional regulator [Clostridiales bacterium]|nr:helix-turn-helix transcriptional regulator [Clostridiales bacterium]
MPEDCAFIIDLLIEQRHSKGMTQQELAHAACLTQSVIARLESKKTMPQLDTLLKIVNALGCDLTITSSPH